MAKNRKNPVKIYRLIDPRNDAIRYIGATSKLLEIRLLEHYYSQDGNEGKVEWIKDLREHGIKPDIEAIEDCEAKLADEREYFWIQQHLRMGCNLLNVSNVSQANVKRKYTHFAVIAYGHFLQAGLGDSSVSYDDWLNFDDEKKSFFAFSDEPFLSALETLITSPENWQRFTPSDDETPNK